MSDAHKNRGACEYLWFSLLLILILATSATHSPAPDTASALPDTATP